MRVAIIFVSLLLKNIVWCIPLNEFYPFGSTENDNVLPRSDDGSSPEVSLSSVFPFYDKNFQTLYVNTNGALSFTETISMYEADEFPTSRGYEIMAVYWADVDTTGTGGVGYHESRDIDLLQRTSDHVKRAFPTMTFSPTYLFIATWDRVGFYQSQTIKTNTFQAVLATDGRLSFVLYLYADGEIQWTNGDGSHGFDGLHGIPTQVGFDAGDGIRHTAIPTSYTDAIINVTHTSNAGIPGMWVFRVDGETMVIGGCQSTADNGNAPIPLSLYPRYGNVLGGTVVEVFGPCFDAYMEHNITCSFDGITVAGVYVDGDSIICISPALTTLGRVDFVLSISGTTDDQFEKATFYSLTPNDASSIELNDEDFLYMSNDRMEITWDQNSLIPRSLTDKHNVIVTVDIQLAEVDVETGNTQTVASLASDVANNGRYQAMVPSDYEGISSAVVKITIANIENGDSLRSLVGHLENVYNQIKEQLAHWSKEIYVSSGSNILREQCVEWYGAEPDRTGDDLLDRLPSCPPTESRMTYTFVKEDYGDAFREFFHPGTSSCYRQALFTSDNQGSGQQCCYDSNGYLVVGQPGGGTVDRYAPNTFMGRLKHLHHDVLPYVYCCRGDFKEYTCNMYYKKRPSDDGSHFSLQPPACLYGDPHLVTLDGYKYTFNGKGEFTLVGHEDNTFTLQGRMVEVKNSNGMPASATVFSAIAAKQYDSDVVEFRQSRRGLDALVNGVMVDFENLSRQEFNNVILSDMGNQMLSALFTSGAHLQAKVENGIISVLLVSLPDSFYNATYGLMGAFNNDMTDDLMIKNSTQYLPLNSSNDEIHMQFGLSWIVGADQSLFTYSISESWETYHDDDFSPSYDLVFVNLSLESRAMDVCDNDQFCLYDIATTGRVEIGMSTLDGSRTFNEIVKLSYAITCDPPCEQGACVANNTCNCAEGYTGGRCTELVPGQCDVNRCKNGGSCTKIAVSYVCDCTSGYTGLLCQHFNASSDDDSDDNNSLKDLLEEPMFVIIVSVAGGGVVLLVVMIICIVGCCCHRWRNRRGKLAVTRRPTHTNPMYDRSLFLVPDKPKTNTVSSSIRPLVPRTADSIGMPAPHPHTYSNYNSTQRDYDDIDIAAVDQLHVTSNPSYTVP